jgi:hypothetical protein
MWVNIVILREHSDRRIYASQDVFMRFFATVYPPVADSE